MALAVAVMKNGIYWTFFGKSVPVFLPKMLNQPWFLIGFVRAIDLEKIIIYFPILKRKRMFKIIFNFRLDSKAILAIHNHMVTLDTWTSKSWWKGIATTRSLYILFRGTISSKNQEEVVKRRKKRGQALLQEGWGGKKQRCFCRRRGPPGVKLVQRLA